MFFPNLRSEGESKDTIEEPLPYPYPTIRDEPILKEDDATDPKTMEKGVKINMVDLGDQDESLKETCLPRLRRQVLVEQRSMREDELS